MTCGHVLDRLSEHFLTENLEEAGHKNWIQCLSNVDFKDPPPPKKNTDIK